MTYSELIDLISREVLDEDVWPTDPQDEQEDKLNLCYVAVLAVACEVPLHRLQSNTSDLQSGPYKGTVIEGPLPDDIFTQRADLGIVHLILDGEIKPIDEAVSFSSINQASENSLQADNKLFAVDMSGKSIYANATSSIEVKYVADFPFPTMIGDVPLTGKDIQRAAHIVASHVTGSRARDMAASQFNQILNQQYTN